MDKDPRYQWLEKRIVACLNPKRDTLLNLTENEDNKLVLMEFLNNEDVKQIYIYLKSPTQIVAARSCTNEVSVEKGILFLKLSNSSKLTSEQMSEQITYFESSNQIFNHMDLITRDVFMPLLCTDINLNDQADKLMDVMHRIISQVAIAHSQIEDSVSLPLPALNVLAAAANNPNRRLTVLHILETTLISWQKLIKNTLKQQPDVHVFQLNFYTKDEIQLWTSYINKLNNLIVQLDAPHVKDILVNLENNKSAYIQPFYSIKMEIKSSIISAETNLRYVSTLTPWIHKIKSSNLSENAQYLFTGLMHTILLIWKNSKFYHFKDRFTHMLLFLSNEIVSVSKQVVGDKILDDPLRSYNKLKEALKICAMFRGTYLDFKEKADALNTKYYKQDKKIDFDQKDLWWVQQYSNEDTIKAGTYDEFEVMRQNSPWPKRNHNCFYYLNVFMERCNDVLELVQTMRHFQILSKTVSIGGSDNYNMDILAQEIHRKYVYSISDFQKNVTDVMSFEQQGPNFEISFFNLRTTVKELERELSKILNLSIKHCTTISSKLRLLEVFEGVHERDVIQNHLSSEYNWLIRELLKEFSNVRSLCDNVPKNTSPLPSVVNLLFWYHGLEQRIKLPMAKFSYLYPNLLQGDLGYKLRDEFKRSQEHIQKKRNEVLEAWYSTIGVFLTDKLQQCVLRNVSIDDVLTKRPSAVEVNLDYDLERLLKEIHYLQSDPLNIDLSNVLKDKFSQLKDENKLRLYATRIRSIANNYNTIMANIQPEETALFELKLNKIDHIIQLGLMKYTWNSVEIPDYIESAHSIISMDVFQNLELAQTNAKEIVSIVNFWCEYESDIFEKRDRLFSQSAKEIEERQIEFHSSFKKEIIRGGKRIHTLIASTLKAVDISEASPGWQEYLNYMNEVILNGFKTSSFKSLKSMFSAMTEPEELSTPFVCINMELIDGKLIFEPPLDENCHLKNLQEILFDFINLFIARGSFMTVLGKNRANFDQMVAQDESIFEIVKNINMSIGRVCQECKKMFEMFNGFSFLWTNDIHQIFENFLRGSVLLSRDNKPRPPSKNFMNQRNAASKSIASLNSLITPEFISNIERTFLSPYFAQLSKQEKELCLTPLLEDFDSEIAVYMNTQDKIKGFLNYNDVEWIRINLEPLINVLVTLTNKLIWKFTNFLSSQIKTTLSELDLFLKRMEPDIEKITGEERDTATFMKIMRMFNEVSSKQQELEIKFELMKRTITLLKKYKFSEVYDLEAKFNTTPIRWTNLKSKVTLAKQRLGPTINQEAKSIIKDLQAFLIVITTLVSEFQNSYLFDRGCDSDRAFKLLDDFTGKFNRLQNQAEDLKQLQELLEANVVDFHMITKSRITLTQLRQTWKVIKDIRLKHHEWKTIRWQKVNTRTANEETDQQLELINNLPTDAQVWDVVLGAKNDIMNIKNCLPVCEEIANPAMRTRHWKQLVRISSSGGLVDNEMLKMLTFGQLLDLNLQLHLEEVRLIVQKAVKDLSLEQTLKTYEEIWLSKVFKLKLYVSLKTDTEKQIIPDEDEAKSYSNDRRLSISKGAFQPANSLNKSGKRLSIGSLPPSLIGAEPIGDSEPIFLIEDIQHLFNEMEHHQVVLAELLLNQSAGSFYDEIIKWQSTLQHIEAVLQEWNKCQIFWTKLETIYSSYEIQAMLGQDTVNFYKSDKDFRVLMKATHKNPNILKCSQRKNILNILRHLNRNFQLCSENILAELAKKRLKCPRLFLLNDEDLLQVLTCANNIEKVSTNIGKVFNQIEALKISQNHSNPAGYSVEGFYGKFFREYVPLKSPIAFSNVENFIMPFQAAISETLKHLLKLALNGEKPPVEVIDMNQTKSNKSDSKHVSNYNRNLPVIKENVEEASQEASVFSWLFLHPIQIVDLTLNISLTEQIEKHLKESKFDEMDKLQAKLNDLLTLFNHQLNSYSFEQDNNETYKLGILMKSEQHEKLEYVVKLLAFYRNFISRLIKNKATINSPEWLNRARYYVSSESNDLQITVKTSEYQYAYGFEYISVFNDDECNPLYFSPNVDLTLANLISLINLQASPLVYGSKTKNILNALSILVGYENHYFLCSQNTSIEIVGNIAKAMVLGGYWVTFLNLQNLTPSLMSLLSNILTQINSRQEKVSINNEQFISVLKSPNIKFANFATVEDLDHRYLTDSPIDSLKVTKIDHHFSLISKDLLDKFRIVKYENTNLKNFIDLNLITSGLVNHDAISTDLLKFYNVYKNLLKVKTDFNKKNGYVIDSSIFKLIIREAANLIHNRKLKDRADLDLKTFEVNIVSSVVANLMFPRTDIRSDMILLYFLKTIWPSIKLPYKYHYEFENTNSINLPIQIDKETPIQVDDKVILDDIADAVSVSTSKLKLAPSILFQTRAVNIIELLLGHKNLVLIGSSGTGKTTIIKTAIAALSELGYFINQRNIYINSYSNEELFGDGSKSSPNQEGLISVTLKNFDSNSNFNVLHIVGESQPENFFLYDSLFSNEFFFLNQNNEKIFHDLSKLKLIWETDDISNLSPSILATSNMIYLDHPLISWEHLVISAFMTFSNADRSANLKSLQKELINKLHLVQDELNRNIYQDVLNIRFEAKVRLVLSILKNLLKNNFKWDENDVTCISEYCIASGMSASMTYNSREPFNEFIKSVFKTYPSEARIYDYFYDIDSHQYQLWSDNIPTFTCPIHSGIPLNLYVHTPSSTYLSSMLDIMMNMDESFMIVGETGCGKTSLVIDKLKTSCSGDLSDVFYITINTNKQTNSNYLHGRINSHLSWIHNTNYLPKGNKKMFCFIDDLHQAKIDEHSNRQTAAEFLRQHLDSNSFYDFGSKKWQNVSNVTYVTTFNTKVYIPSKSVSNKILKHFHVVAQHFPTNSETHGIYTKLLYRHLIGDVENESSNVKTSAGMISRLKNLQNVLKNIIQSSIELNHKVRQLYLDKPQRLHYVFSLRVLTSLFRLMCLSLGPDASKEQILLLWHHECDWLYGHRMYDYVDVERYKLAYKTVIKANFDDHRDLEILNRAVYFSNLRENESGIIISSVAPSQFFAPINTSVNTNTIPNVLIDGYQPTNDLPKLRELIQSAIIEYNKEHQRILIPLYESTITLICRLCHSVLVIGGNTCVVADGGISGFVFQLVASIMQYSLINFKVSGFMYSKHMVFQQLRHKLVQTYYKAGIKGEKIMLLLMGEDMNNKDFLGYVTEFLVSEEIQHLFTIEEETTILNSIRTQVIQAGLNYTKETAWEFFVKNIRENTRIVINMNENAEKFQTLCLEYPSLLNNVELIWIQHWSMKELISNASYHLSDIRWLDSTTKDNLAYLLATMHYSIREADSSKSSHLNNVTFTKFVEEFKKLLVKKYREIEQTHKNVCKLLEHIQVEHSIAKKLLVQLQQENMVLEERINSTEKMLQQIGQDMSMTEQQLKVHNVQTKKAIQLKKILPEYQTAHERNLYKAVAILANTKELIKNINMSSLQELRTVQKPDTRMEDVLAAVIMILKSPTADVTWQKGAKRQMANLDRFMEELQTFDEKEITENTIKLVGDLLQTIESTRRSDQHEPYADALNTLHKWIANVIKYHTLMVKFVKPLQKRVDEIEKEVKEADHKLTTLNRKSDNLNARLSDLAQNFEEATVDKKEQEEKVLKMKHQLKTANDLNTILAREFDRNMQIYDSLKERIYCLPGACALAAGFLTYLGFYGFTFRRTMLTTHWIKCLNDRGLPLVLDTLSLIRGRVVKWQMESLGHLLAYSSDVAIPGEDWRVHFAPENVANDTFISGSHNNQEQDTPKLESENKNEEREPTPDNQEAKELEHKPETSENKVSQEKAISEENIIPPRPIQAEENITLPRPPTTGPTSENKMVPGKADDNSHPVNEESLVQIESQAISRLSDISEEGDINGYFLSTNDYKKFLHALIEFIVGEKESLDWQSGEASLMEMENGSIIANAERHPPLIKDSFSYGTKWIKSKLASQLIDMETKNNEDLQIVEKAFQAGTCVLFINSTHMDAALLPLISYKNSTVYSQRDNEKNDDDESKLVLFSNRRLFCTPVFQLYFETPMPLQNHSPSVLTSLTPISYQMSIENLIDMFQLKLFQVLYPEEYRKRALLLNCLKECNLKLGQIDQLLKERWENDGFQEDEILITKIALQRKYCIGDVLEYCQEYINFINELIKLLTPVALRAALLMTLSFKMKSISNNYEFNINLMENLFNDFPSLVNPSVQEFKLKKELKGQSKVENNSSTLTDEKQLESTLPTVPDYEALLTNQMKIYSSDDINLLAKHVTNSYLNKMLISLLPEHRLYMLSLVCFHAKSENKDDFTDLELEFLMKGKYNTNINISLSDFGAPENTPAPKWLPLDNWNDLLAMSLLQGELDHFVIAVLSAEKDWKSWYENPFSVAMPKVEMETEKTGKTEIVELGDFKKLILLKVLRPDAYAVLLNDYVVKSLELKINEPSWSDVFDNPLFKTTIVNMGSKSNISNTSSMSRIHRNLFEIAKRGNKNITALNCNFLTLSELRVELKNASSEYVLLKNVHLADLDVIEFIKNICANLESSDKPEYKWRLIITKSFDFELPYPILSRSVQVAFDVIDIMAHNSVEKNKKISLDTCITRSETIIFNCIQESFNMVKSEEASSTIKNLTPEKYPLVYLICLAQGILQSRQTLACSGLLKFYPWSVQTIASSLIALSKYTSSDFNNFAIYLSQNVYSTFLDDEMDRDYLATLLRTLFSYKDDKVAINGIGFPVPNTAVPPSDYANWLEEKIPSRTVDSRILQLHKSQIIHYNTIRAEDFIYNLERLWESNPATEVRLSVEIEPDWLYYAIKLCYDKLPPLLPEFDNLFKPENSTVYAIYHECNVFNSNMKMIQDHLSNLENFILMKTELFPQEWKTIALSLQCQRVPEIWEHPNCRPSVHSLKSWIQRQCTSYSELKSLIDSKFIDIQSLKADTIKTPQTLLTSLIIQACKENNWDIDDVEIHFEPRENVSVIDGLVLSNLKIIGGKWDSKKKMIVSSDNLVNTLPPVMVVIKKAHRDQIKDRKVGVHLYMNQLRQCWVNKIELKCECSDTIPFLVMDAGSEDAKQSRKLFKPIIPNLIGGISSSQSKNGQFTQTKILSSNEIAKPESQLSYKPLTPIAPPLPANLRTLDRSKPIN